MTAPIETMTQDLPYADVASGAVLETTKDGWVVAPDRVVELARHLRDHEGYDYCSMVTSVDWPDYFEVVYYLYGVFVPIVLMAVPLYDMVSVVTLRLRDRKNPMVGDRRHFSHRLVRRGMKVRTAVLTIYLCTAGTAIAASLLPRVDSVGAVLILAQTFAILLIIALLEGGNDLP